MIKLFKKYIKYIGSSLHIFLLLPKFKLIEVSEENDIFILTVKIVNKNIILKLSPEEILSDDNFTDKFSPRDIRAITYLGYLTKHKPKYKIFSKKILNNKELMLEIRERTKNKVFYKTALEVNKDKDILKNLNTEDVLSIGYIIGSDSVTNEKKILIDLSNN